MIYTVPSTSQPNVNCIDITPSGQNYSVDLSLGLDFYMETTDTGALNFILLNSTNLSSQITSFSVVVKYTDLDKINYPKNVSMGGVEVGYLKLNRYNLLTFKTYNGGATWTVSLDSDWNIDDIIYDLFDRANADTLGVISSGATWGAYGGTWGIRDNKAQVLTITAPSTKVVAYIDTGVSDCEISMKIVPTVAARNGSIAFRITDENNYYRFGIDNNNELILRKYEGGTGSTVLLTVGQAIVAGDIISVKLKNDFIAIYKNGVEVSTKISAFNKTATKHGLWAFSTAGAQFEDFYIKKLPDPIVPIVFGEFVYSKDNFLVKRVGELLHLSTNAGISYTKSVSVAALDYVNYIHVFQEGELLVCDHQKAYYSADWVSLTESTVKNVAGGEFVPTTYDNFGTHLVAGNVDRQIVNGVEILCWGNYSVQTGTATTNINVWYTIDKGVNIKSCFKFGTSNYNGGSTPLTCRHIHNINFDKRDSGFWIQTGDEPTCHWLKGTYNTGTDVWTWNFIATGDDYKSGNLLFSGDYIYYSWDMASGGVRRVLYAEAHIPASHEMIFAVPNDVVSLIMGERGDMLAVGTKYGGTDYPSRIYYSPDGVNFVGILGDIPDNIVIAEASYYNTWPANANGKILSGILDVTNYTNRAVWEKLPSIWLDEVVKNAGFPDAFKPYDK